MSTDVSVVRINSLKSILIGLFLVGWGTILGLAVGFMLLIINSTVLAYAFRMEVGDFVGVLHLVIPAVIGTAMGIKAFRRWREREKSRLIAMQHE
jgi:hypothetical protein